MESFNATLEEAAFSDFLIHVLDASQPNVMEFYQTTMRVLADLGADTKQMLVVFNKVDKVPDPGSPWRNLRGHFPGCGDGERFTPAPAWWSWWTASRILCGKESVTVAVSASPPHASDVLARLHREGVQGAIHYEEDWILVSATMPTSALDHFAPFLAADAPVGEEVAAAPGNQ